MAVTFARYERVTANFLMHVKLLPKTFTIYYVRHTEMRDNLSENDQNRHSHFFALEQPRGIVVRVSDY